MLDAILDKAKAIIGNVFSSFGSSYTKIFALLYVASHEKMIDSAAAAQLKANAFQDVPYFPKNDASAPSSATSETKALPPTPTQSL